MIININDSKKIKKLTLILKDIDDAIKSIEQCEKILIQYKLFGLIQEILSVMQTNKSLLYVKRKKYEKELEEIQK